VDASISPATIRKELSTLGTAWSWARKARILADAYPNDGLAYPKMDDRAPFQTMEQIRRQISLGGMSLVQQNALWECVFLTVAEIAELLDHIRTEARHPWIYPMAAVAAHTGARRSELIRMKVTDVDFAYETLLIREKKRKKGQRSNRHAPLSPFLASVLGSWLATHPGGPNLFCHSDLVDRSKKRSRTTGHGGVVTRASSLNNNGVRLRVRKRPGLSPLTPNEAHDHLRRSLKDSPWEVVRGWHVLRHSFISCCASAGVDQRFIDDWVGHTTAEMRERYRHLVPSAQRRAIRSVFG
jgi:integrase